MMLIGGVGTRRPDIPGVAGKVWKGSFQLPASESGV